MLIQLRNNLEELSRKYDALVRYVSREALELRQQYDEAVLVGIVPRRRHPSLDGVLRYAREALALLRRLDRHADKNSAPIQDSPEFVPELVG